MMFKTSGDATKQMIQNHFNDWSIDTIDNKGRMSLKSIVVSEGSKRESKPKTSNNSEYYLPTT